MLTFLICAWAVVAILTALFSIIRVLAISFGRFGSTYGYLFGMIVVAGISTSLAIFLVQWSLHLVGII